MLESRSCYHPFGENPPKSKGWTAKVVYKNDCNCSRGCTGFKFKKDAERWLKEFLKEFPTGKRGFVGYEIKFTGVERIL